MNFLSLSSWFLCNNQWLYSELCGLKRPSFLRLAGRETFKPFNSPLSNAKGVFWHVKSVRWWSLRRAVWLDYIYNGAVNVLGYVCEDARRSTLRYKSLVTNSFYYNISRFSMFW